MIFNLQVAARVASGNVSEVVKAAAPKVTVAQSASWRVALVGAADEKEKDATAARALAAKTFIL